MPTARPGAAYASYADVLHTNLLALAVAEAAITGRPVAARWTVGVVRAGEAAGLNVARASHVFLGVRSGWQGGGRG